jgi:hypothetical protein
MEKFDKIIGVGIFTLILVLGAVAMSNGWGMDFLSILVITFFVIVGLIVAISGYRQ